MPILTDQILASGISLNDIVHIARPTDFSQGLNGSSYKVSIAQLIDSESCCLSSGIFTSSAETIDFYGLTNQFEFSVTGITAFSGGTNCISNFYLNNILPCNQDIFLQPNATNGRFTYFGSNNASEGFQISHRTDNDNVSGPSFNLTKLALNNGIGSINSYSTVVIKSYDKKTEFRFYDNLTIFNQNLFPNFQEVITLSNDIQTSTSFLLNSNNECGVILGSVNTGDALNGEYGVPMDAFISTYLNTKGLNFVSTDTTDQPTLNGGYFRFYIGCSPDMIGVGTNCHLLISGNDPVKGFLRVGFHSLNPTSHLDTITSVSNQFSYGYTQLRLRTQYTPTSSGDTNGNIGEITWDDDYLYIKSSVSPHTWNRMSLSSF